MATKKPTPEELLNTLDTQTKAHQNAKEALAQARADLDPTIRAVIEAGILSEVETAKRVGLNHLTVRRIQGKTVTKTPWPRPAKDS